MGNIGRKRRRIEVLPEPQSTPEPAHEPATPPPSAPAPAPATSVR
jgi:hypothetical protein